MSIKLLQHALLEARGGRHRWQIADRAAQVSGGHSGLDEKAIERHECRIRTPPDNGLLLRTHCAAADLNLLDTIHGGQLVQGALTLLGYWPPLGLGPGQIPLAILTDTCRRLGIQLTHHDPSTGRVVIQL